MLYAKHCSKHFIHVKLLYLKCRVLFQVYKWEVQRFSNRPVSQSQLMVHNFFLYAWQIVYHSQRTKLNWCSKEINQKLHHLYQYTIVAIPKVGVCRGRSSKEPTDTQRNIILWTPFEELVETDAKYNSINHITPFPLLSLISLSPT